MRLLQSFQHIRKHLGRERGPRSGRFRRRLLCESLETRQLLSGTWTALKNPIPSGDGAGTMLLLSNGTVLAQGGGDNDTTSWYELTPDSTGSYVNGTWSQVQSSEVGRLFYGSDVLPSGSVYVAGGEYSTVGDETNTGEIYDPTSNQWTAITPYPESYIGDGISETLPGGRVLQGSCCDGNLYIYTPSTNSWSTDPGLTLPNGDSSSEEGWVKLPDGSTLQYEIEGTKPQTANRLVLGTTDAQDHWVSAGRVPVPLASNGGNPGIVPELGPGVLMPNGDVFWVGASGYTAIYSPLLGSYANGRWTAGPVIAPNSSGVPTLGGFDSPAAVEPNGDVLFAVSGINGYTYPGPTQIYEYSPVGNTLTQVTPSGLNLTNISGYTTRMLVLPSGQILFTDGFDSSLYVYTPSGAPSASWEPTISGITSNGGGSYTLTGTQLNGLDEGAAYGDDAQMDSNYPIVRLTNQNGQVSYATTSNWSSEWVATGKTAESTNFTLPASDGPGTYHLSVIANGIASASVTFMVSSSGSATVTIDTSAGDSYVAPGTVAVNLAETGTGTATGTESTSGIENVLGVLDVVDDFTGGQSSNHQAHFSAGT